MSTVCETRGHKLMSIFTNEQRCEVHKAEAVTLNKEVYHGCICLRCGTVFDRLEGG